MVRREGKGPPSRDLMVCFPTRAHLTLMPKPVCSPVRHSEPRRNLYRKHSHLRKSMRGGVGGASPYLWSKTKHMSSDNLSEPTSPKVTCAGQIKVRNRTGSCKNWQTVMEEIERLHNNRKKKPNWMEALGFKKEVMQFLNCLRRIKFDFQCFGTLPHVDVTSDDEDEDNDVEKIHQDQHHRHHLHDHDHEEKVPSRTTFSKWFMVLQGNQDCGVFQKDEKSLKSEEKDDPSCLPPSNALLLMRCRSAPAKSWMEERHEEEEEEEEEEEDDDGDDDDEEDDHDDDRNHDNDHDDDDDEKTKEKEKKRKSLMELMQKETDFYKLSTDIAKETWVIGGINKHLFSRSTSWKT